MTMGGDAVLIVIPRWRSETTSRQMFHTSKYLYDLNLKDHLQLRRNDTFGAKILENETSVRSLYCHSIDIAYSLIQAAVQLLLHFKFLRVRYHLSLIYCSLKMKNHI